MSRLVRVALGICVALALAGCGDDGGDRGDRGDGDGGANPAGDRSTETPSSAAAPAVVADEAWCRGWQELVLAQAAYVATPAPEAATAVISAVDSLQSLGVPKSLDPAGYTELNAVLDDVRASADPSFTPSIAPSEPADVGAGHDHDHGDTEEAEDEHRAAPFGTWLADHCAA